MTENEQLDAVLAAIIRALQAGTLDDGRRAALDAVRLAQLDTRRAADSMRAAHNALTRIGFGSFPEVMQ